MRDSFRTLAKTDQKAWLASRIEYKTAGAMVQGVAGTAARFMLLCEYFESSGYLSGRRRISAQSQKSGIERGYILRQYRCCITFRVKRNEQDLHSLCIGSAKLFERKCHFR